MKQGKNTKHRLHILKTIGLIGCTDLHDSLMECVKQQLGAEDESQYVYCNIDRRLIDSEWGKVRDIVLRNAFAFRYMDVAAIAFTTPELYEFAPRVADRSGLKIIHLGDIIGQAIKNSGLRRVGFLGSVSDASKDPILSRIDKVCDAEFYMPTDWYMKRVKNVIKRMECSIDYKYSGADEEVLFGAVSNMHLDNEIQGVVLNCPEFRRIFNDAAKNRFRSERINNQDFQFFDSTELLVKALVEFACN